MQQLITLAERLVSLDREAGEVRAQMLRLLTSNGHDADAPPEVAQAPLSGSPKGRSAPRARLTEAERRALMAGGGRTATP
jgi:hypothetical protein